VVKSFLTKTLINTAILANSKTTKGIIFIYEPFRRLELIEKNDFLNNIWKKYIGRLKEKHTEKFKKWEAWALVSFVAIPLPMTGAFSGAVAASIFQIKIKKVIPLILLGCMISGTIVTLMTLAFSL
jgi:uncharacterized membrane protein